jgi:hypothetical protein
LYEAAWTSIPREECLTEHFISKKLNPGNEPNKIRDRKVTEITPGTDKIGNLVSNWCVSDDNSITPQMHSISSG